MSHTYVHFFYVKTIIDVLYGLDTKKKRNVLSMDYGLLLR